MKIKAILAGTLLSLAFAAGALAATATYTADLKGSQEVPANDTAGTGSAELTYDPATKHLAWKVTYSGLTGPATAAHIHGPAAPGTNAGVAIKFENPASPVEGSATLTDAQAADLEGGKWYVNVHTSEHKSGEIRGQVMPAK
jgi:CHRD domain